MNRAVFLDRDGVITQDPPHYAHKIDQLSLIPRSEEAIKRLNENGFKVVVVTNQSGVARGYYQEKDVEIFNHAMKEALRKKGACIDAIYYCPHHPDAKLRAYRIDCECRKPKLGLFLKASRELEIDLKKSFMVGDKCSDIEAGKRMGCKVILVKTGHGAQELKNQKVICDFIAYDLFDAIEHILLLADMQSEL